MQLNAEYATVLSRRIASQQSWEFAQKQDPLNLPQSLDNFAIQNLLQERATIQAEYEQELQRRKLQMPRLPAHNQMQRDGDRDCERAGE